MSGRPMLYSQHTVKKAFSLEVEVVEFLKAKGNQSQYVNSLIRTEMGK